MFWNAKSGSVHIDNTEMDYITFGMGKENLVMIPGLGDGLTTVKGMAAILAFTYKSYAKDYKVYIFSRKNNFERKIQSFQSIYSTREMAKDLAFALNTLGIIQTNVLGISQGGMLAQYLAIDYPALVNKLVLVVTLSKQNETVQAVLNNWIQLAKESDYESLIIDTAEKSYSEKYLKKYRCLYPLLCKIGKPKDFQRFIMQAQSCAEHNAYELLNHIICPTLVIGGSCDKIVTAAASVEIANKINKSELFIYEGLGHAVYEEAKDFNSRVIAFLK